MQRPAYQPTPTRCPTLSLLACGPTAVTRPVTSWLRIAGYCEMPQSLFKTERSEWTHTAVCDSDFHVLGPERSELNAFEHHRLFRRLRDPCLMMHRVSHVETAAAARLSVHPTWARSVL